MGSAHYIERLSLFAKHSVGGALADHVYVQDNISKAERFYGKALLVLLEALPVNTGRQAHTLESWRARLRKKPEASAIEFENVLKSLKDAVSVRVQPVFLIDE